MSWQELEKEPIENLIEYIKWKDSPGYAEIAKDAFRVLCFRLQKDLVHKCRIISKKWGYDNQIGDLIAEKTFDRYWKYPISFDPAKCKKELNICITLYLYKIAQNVLCDFHATESGDNFNPYSGEEEIVKEFPDLENFSLAPEKLSELKRIQEIINNALGRLSPKHKIIYLTYKAHQKDGYKLPRTLLKSLRDELDLSQASIQVYKKEAFDTVDTYLKIYGQK